MDDDTLNSPNNDDIEPTERDDPIVVLYENDFVGDLSYNNEIISTDEIIRTDNQSTNLVSLSQLSPLSTPSSSTRKAKKRPLPNTFIDECRLENVILKIDDEGNEKIKSINNVDFSSILTRQFRKISCKLVPGSTNLNPTQSQMEQLIINAKKSKCIPNTTSSSKGRGDVLHLINVLFSDLFFERVTGLGKRPSRTELTLKDLNHLTSLWNDVHTEYHKTGLSEYDDIKFGIDHYKSTGMDPLNFKERTQKQLMDMFHDVCTAYRKVHNTSGHHEDDFLSLEKQKTFGKVWESITYIYG